jgi:hypothetical protein
MKKSILIIFLIPSILFSQDLLKEEDSFYENGKPEVVTYKNLDLEIVKRETYSPSGKLLSLYNYDPKTGKRDGDFTDLDNKGYYNQGVLNCDDYTFAIEGDTYDGTGTFWNGKIKNGRPVGEIRVYKITEKLEVADTQLDTELSYYASVDAGRRVNLYRAVYRSLGYKTDNISNLFYNEDGHLEGKQKINNLTDLYYSNGYLKGIVIKNKENLNKAKDSVFRENKIWKIDNKFLKNKGFYLGYIFDELFLTFRQEGKMLFNSDNSEMNEILGYQNIIAVSKFENVSPYLNEMGIYSNIIIDNVRAGQYSDPNLGAGIYGTGPRGSLNPTEISKYSETFSKYGDATELNLNSLEEVYFNILSNPIPGMLLIDNANYFNDYYPGFITTKEFFEKKIVMVCNVIKLLEAYINQTDLSKINKEKLNNLIKNHLDCQNTSNDLKRSDYKGLTSRFHILDLLNKLKETRLLSFSDMYIYDEGLKNYKSVFKYFLNEIENEKAQQKIQKEKELVIKKELSKQEEKKEITIQMTPNDLKYRIENNKQFGKSLVVDFSPRENKKQIVHDAISEELMDILPIGYNIDNSSIEIIISDKIKKYNLSEINDLKQDLSDEKSLSKLLKNVNKNYSKYDKDKFLGLDNTNINKPSFTLSSISLSEFDFDSDIIISSWLRNELYRGATSLYFPEESFLFGGYLMPNKVAIFKDPKSVNTIIHLFFYEYPNLNFNENIFDNNYRSKGDLESRSQRYSAILLRGADFWNNNNREVWRGFVTGQSPGGSPIVSEYKMNLTSSDYSGFLSRRIQSNDLIKNSYSELFGISDPNSINVKAFIFGENGIQYLGIE